MNKRIIKKWKSHGIYDEMMARHRSHRGGSLREAWRPRWVGERNFRDLYLQIQEEDPTNHLLGLFTVDGHNHLRCSPAYYKAHQKEFPNEDVYSTRNYAKGEPIGRLTLLTALRSERDLLKNLRVLGEDEVQVKPAQDNLLTYSSFL